MRHRAAAAAAADRRGSAPIYFAMLAPIAGLIALAAVMIADAIAEQGRSVDLARKIALSTEASNLAHELQKERGMSAGHVGSKGAQFGPQLREQRALTDAVLAEVRDAVTGRAGDGGRFEARAERLERAFQSLAATRARIDALSITVPELATFYTGAIRKLLSLPDDLLIKGALDEIARQNTVYKDILMAKEFAGVERAAGSVGFGGGAFDDKTFAWFNGLQQRQFYLFDRIREIGSAQERARLDAALKSAAAARVAELRALAAESLKTGDVKGVAGPDWFKASTAYLPG
ncbi:MAG: nitrate- and nitrite sensing domain-containing protein [Pseudomonadota bacterium]